jgi:cellulose synthase/poly-beta-1,6-N-acetylglucosamine synthase-like glycosyltransferase
MLNNTIASIRRRINKNESAGSKNDYQNCCIVSVIVVVKNGRKTISRCLESLLQQNFPKEKYEIIVVDGGSTDGTQEIVRKYSVRLVIDENGTIGHSRNVGIKVSKGKYVAFIDSDCIADKEWLRILVEALEREGKNTVAVGGPNLVPNDDPPISRLIGYIQETFLGSGGSPQSYTIKEPKYVYSLPNCNAMYRKSILAQEKYDDNFNVGEDSELNFRLKEKGYRMLYLPNAIVWHSRVNSIKKFIRKMFVYGTAMARIIRKHKKLVRWYAPLPSIGVFLLISWPFISKPFPIITPIYITLLLTYFIMLLISTIQVYIKYKNMLSILTLILLPLQHMAYGIGFLNGILRGEGS